MKNLPAPLNPEARTRNHRWQIEKIAGMQNPRCKEGKNHTPVVGVVKSLRGRRAALLGRFSLSHCRGRAGRVCGLVCAGAVKQGLFTSRPCGTRLRPSTCSARLLEAAARGPRRHVLSVLAGALSDDSSGWTGNHEFSPAWKLVARRLLAHS